MSSSTNNNDDKLDLGKGITLTLLGVAAVFSVVNNVMTQAEARVGFTDQVCQELNEKNWNGAHEVIAGKIAKTNRLHTGVLDQIRCENGEYILDTSMLSGNEELREIAIKNIGNPLQVDKNKLTYMDKAARNGDLKSFQSMHSNVNDRISIYEYNFLKENASGAAPIQHIVDGGSQELFDFALDNIKNPSELSKTNPELVKYVNDNGTDGMKKSLDEKTGNTKTSMVAKQTNSSDYSR